MPVLEEDFPRGKPVRLDPSVTASPSKKRKIEDDDNQLFGTGEKRKSVGKNKKAKTFEPKAKITDGLWIKNISYDYLTEGVMGMAVVIEVHEDHLILETVDSCNLKLPANQIGKQFTKLLKADKLSLEQCFSIGQMIPFRVITEYQKGEGNKKKGLVLPIVSCDPAKLNAHLVPAKLSSGLVIHAIVESIEEKGAVLDIGLSAIKGFLPKEKQPSKGIYVGQPILTRIESQDSRIVKVTAFVEQDHLSVEACDKLQLNHLMPGTIVDCLPTEAEPLARGVIVSLGNDVKALIMRKNLPPRLRADTSRFTRSIRCVVMMCAQNANLLVLSAHPDLVAVTKIEKRSDFQGINVGDKLNCKVIDVNLNSANVAFSLPMSDDGKIPLITAHAFKTLLHNVDDLEEFYKVGSEHVCRVIGFRYADRCLVVTTRKDKIKQSAVSYKELSPGQIVEAKVVNVHEKGAHLLINDDIKGYLAHEFACDKVITMDKAFPVDKVFKCRVLLVDDERKRVNVIARPSVVKYGGTLITSYDSALTGQISLGVIVHTLSNSYLVAFLNNVKGLLPFSKTGDVSLRVGNAVEVRVLDVKPEENTMFLAMADAAAASSKHLLKYEASPLPIASYTGTVREVRIANVGGKHIESVTLTVKHKRETHDVILSSQHASDALDQPFESFSGTFKEGKKVSGLVPLGTSLGVNRVCAKGLVCDWLEISKTSPTKFEDLKEGQLVCGIVVHKLEMGIFIEIVGGSGLVGKIMKQKGSVKNEDELGFQLGQTVVCRILHLNANKSFTVTQVIDDCFPNQENLADLAVRLVRSYVNELKSLALSMDGVPVIGSQVNTIVTHVVDDTAFVKFNNNIIGHIKNGNYPEGTKAGDELNCLIMDYAFPRRDAELVTVPKKVKKGKKVSKEEEEIRVVQVKRDYFVVLKNSSLCFVPNRLHPNIVPASKKGRVSLGETVKVDVIDEMFENVSYGLLDGDQELISKISKGTAEGSKKSAIKNLQVYTATVMGPWDLPLKEGGPISTMAVRVKLPGDNIGRLHISEFPMKLIGGKKNVLKVYEDFLKNKNLKNINVRVIEINKSKINSEKIRIADVTMNEDKLSIKKLRAKKLHYQPQFEVGEGVVAYATGETNAKGSVVEVTPYCHGLISAEALSAEYILKNETSDMGAVVEANIPRGEVLQTAVLAFSAKKRFKQLKLAMGPASVTRTKKNFSFGDKVVGRAKRITKQLTVEFVLDSGHIAILPISAISDKYEKSMQYLNSFNKNEIFHLHFIRNEMKPKKTYVMTESRYNSVVKEAQSTEDFMKSPRSLIPDRIALKTLIGHTVDGFITNHTEHLTFIEIGAGISGAIKRSANSPLTNQPIGSVVTVLIQKVDENDNKILLKFKNIVCTPSVQVVTKRETSPEPAVEKSEKNSKNTEPAYVIKKIEDPGFDFSNSGYKPEDLAEIGKIGQDSLELTVSTTSKKDESSKKQKSKRGQDSDIENNPVKNEENVDEDQPQNDNDFNRLISKDPNSAEPWIKYMSFFLEKNDLEKARATAERALTAIHYREEAEISNMWTAYLNMEVAFGDMSTARSVFEKSCQNADSLKMHKQMALILANNDKIEEADEIYDTMIKKFRASSDDVWAMYATHLMNTERVQKGRDLLQRALSSIPKARHCELITKFAQLEFKKGDAEKGRTLFESLITAYPKKTDIVLVYVDIIVKHSGIEDARAILDRACNLRISMHKLRPMFKKWMELEERYGDEKSQALVRTMAEKCVKDIVENL